MKYKLFNDSLNDIFSPIETVLRNRGIYDVKQYLNLTEDVVQDYHDLNNIEHAVECFMQHFENKDKILVMPDCDADGYTSSAMLYGYIKMLDPDYPIEYIIHKQPKSHGLANDMDIIPDDAKLFIIADAGSNDAQECGELISRGLDIIILDHHDDSYQEADEDCEINYQAATFNNAIIVNNQMSDDYHNKQLSGAGIVYRFLQALDDELWEDNADYFLDLCAIGNAADVMDMRSLETRYLVDKGIDNINNQFIEALLEAQSFSTKGIVNIHNITWYVSPVINAVARIGTREERELLFKAITGCFKEEFEYKKRSGEIVIENIFDHTARISKNIKGKQDRMRDKTIKELDSQVNTSNKVIMLESLTTEPGLAGLSAIRLSDKYKRPVIVVKRRNIDGNDIMMGSCRNFDGSPIEDFKQLILDSGMFIMCQGHPNAAGLSISADNFEKAVSKFNQMLKDVRFDNPTNVDFLLDIDDLNVDLFQTIDQYKDLWCKGVEEPVVAIQNITISRDQVSLQGKNLDSVAFKIGDIKFVAFKLLDDNPLLEFASAWDGNEDDTITLNIIGNIGLNEYESVYTCQCIINECEAV